MNWVRTNIRLGARLALIALALQFAAAFGHFHALPDRAVPIQIASAVGPGQPDTDHHSDGAADVCAVCAVVALAGSMLDAAPPVLPLRQAQPLQLDRPTSDAPRGRTATGAFQPRGPPLS